MIYMHMHTHAPRIGAIDILNIVIYIFFKFNICCCFHRAFTLCKINKFSHNLLYGERERDDDDDESQKRIVKTRTYHTQCESAINKTRDN